MAQRAQQQNEGLPFPEEFKVFALEQSKGLNTKDARSAIDDQETSWQENFIRIGNGNLRTLWDVGGAVYTAPANKTIVSFFPFNIGSTNYIAAFLNDGTADQVNLGTLAVTQMSTTANTFFIAGGQRPRRRNGDLPESSSRRRRKRTA